MSYFLWIGTIFPFFHLDWKTPESAHCLKIMCNGLRIEEPQIFSIHVLKLSCPCGLPESNFWIILAVSYWEKVTKDKRLSVKYWICLGRVVALFVKEHCFWKRWIEKFSFFQEISYKFVFVKIRGIFLLFKKHFNKD